MIGKKIVIVFVVLLSLYAVPVSAEQPPMMSEDVALFMSKNGMTVFEDPEVKALQEKIAKYGQIDMEDFSEEESDEAIALIDSLLSTIERVAREYMSGERVSTSTVVTVQHKEDLPSCVDDGSCNKVEPEIETKVELESEMTTFGGMLNDNQTGSIEAVRESLNL